MAQARATVPGWYSNRGYVHFDVRLDLDTATELVESESRVAARAFWPLVRFSTVERKVDKAKPGWKRKRRPIAYASHADAHIFAYYSAKLGALYDNLLREEGLNDVVLAYRKHADPNDPSRGKASFDFAAEAFADIASRPACEAVALDIKSFFDRIPHSELKRNWKAVIGLPKLPLDHYAVYKAATKFATVPLRQICKVLGIGRKKLRGRLSFGLDRKRFDDEIRAPGLINANRKNCGIPQGLPISGVLANIAMLNVDRVMHAAALAVGGTYRRYSDDILIIAPVGETAALELRLKACLAPLELVTHPDKTAHATATRDEEGKLSVVSPLQYLGLEFDGKRVLVRPQTLVRFNKRMKRAVRRAQNAARKATPKGQPIRIRRRNLYAKFSHLRPHPETREDKRPRGSFLRYAGLAAKPTDNLGSLLGFKSEIRRQLRPLWARLRRLILNAEAGTFGTRRSE